MTYIRILGTSTWLACEWLCHPMHMVSFLLWTVRNSWALSGVEVITVTIAHLYGKRIMHSDTYHTVLPRNVIIKKRNYLFNNCDMFTYCPAFHTLYSLPEGRYECLYLCFSIHKTTCMSFQLLIFLFMCLSIHPELWRLAPSRNVPQGSGHSRKLSPSPYPNTPFLLDSALPLW